MDHKVHKDRVEDQVEHLDLAEHLDLVEYKARKDLLVLRVLVPVAQLDQVDQVGHLQEL
jgi:hypothetical protein